MIRNINLLSIEIVAPVSFDKRSCAFVFTAVILHNHLFYTFYAWSTLYSRLNVTSRQSLLYTLQSNQQDVTSLESEWDKLKASVCRYSGHPNVKMAIIMHHGFLSKILIASQMERIIIIIHHAKAFHFSKQHHKATSEFISTLLHACGVYALSMGEFLFFSRCSLHSAVDHNDNGITRGLMSTDDSSSVTFYFRAR